MTVCQLSNDTYIVRWLSQYCNNVAKTVAQIN